MKKVAVVILNYRVKDLTVECIRSVQKSSYENILIYVVDNGSGDGLEKDIEKMDGVKFIQTGANLGFTGGNNAGIKEALKEGASFIFILNPDTEVDHSCISEGLKIMEDAQVGVVGPKILFPDKKTIWYTGGIMDKLNVIGSHRGVDEKDCSQYDVEEETDYVSGAAMLVRAEVFAKIGLFDERYFLYYEDSDFCHRAKQSGFKIMYAPKAKVFHQNAKSTGLGSPLQDYYISRNRFLFASKFLPLRTQLALLREALKNISFKTKRRAFFDFLVGNLGKGSI